MSGRAPKAGWRGVAAALALVLGGVALWRAVATRTGGNDRPVSSAAGGAPGAGPARVATLERGLAMLEDAQRSGSKTRWDPADVVAQVGTDPQALLDWVRTRTFWVPYRGVLRGAHGVLLDRQGNGLDRALLLSALLARAGHSHRLARATLSLDQAREILPLVLTRRPLWSVAPGGAPPRSTGEIRQAVARYDLDSAGLVHPLEERVAWTGSMFDTLNARTAEQSARLLEMLGRRANQSDWLERVDSAMGALRDHWWIQVQRNGDWVDLDPAGRLHAGRLAPPEETLPPEMVAASLHHRVVVRVVAERSTGAAFTETVVLSHSQRASDSIGRSLQLQILPEEWPDARAMARGAGAAVRDALVAQTAWRVTLLAGGQAVADARLTSTGETRQAAAGGPLGGLGEGIANALGGERKNGDLTAAWLEYEILAPGQPPDTMRRVLFDLRGDPARDSALPGAPVVDDPARLRRSLALLRSTEILPLPAALVPEFVVHLMAAGVLRNRALLHAAATDSLQGADPSSQPTATPLPSSLHALALARFESKDTADVFLARPNILTRHTFLVEDRDRFRVVEATDIVANDVAVDLRERDGFWARLRQGVRDTNAEALLPRQAGSFNAVAQAFAAAGNWLVVDSTAMLGDRLPAPARHRIAAERRAGFLVVAPQDAVRIADREFLGWWRIDSRTGHTLGVGANGWGQSMAERAAITFVTTFWFEYLICNGAFLWGQRTESFAPPFPFSLVSPLAAMEREPCSVDALVTALVAAGIEIVAVTWPLVLRTIAGRGYSGIFSERPWFATGEGDPGDLPPLFGNRPGSGAPTEDCKPGGGASPSQRPSEPAPPEPAEPAGPNQPPSDPGRPPAGGEEGGPAPAPDDLLPPFPNDGTGIRPLPPEQVQAKVPAATAHADAMERELDEALIAHRQSADELREAELALERATARDAEIQRTYPHGSDERNQAYEEWLALSREARTKADLFEAAAKQVRRAQYAAELARYRASWLGRVAGANRAAHQSAQALDEATAAWQRTGMTDYNSPEYARFREASERYRQAQRELSDKFWDQASPPGGTDNTVPAPARPSMPPTEPAPAPGGGGSPRGSSGPAGCGGSPASPAAQSVGGVVAAGAGVGAAGGR